MKVILLENIKKIGSIGEIIEVKRGFGRNFLIANKSFSRLGTVQEQSKQRFIRVGTVPDKLFFPLGTVPGQPTNHLFGMVTVPEQPNKYIGNPLRTIFFFDWEPSKNSQ